MTTASRMISPPIVGVPRLPWWLASPSERTTWPIFLAREPRDDRGPDEEREQERGEHRSGGAKADVVEEIEEDVLVGEGSQEMIQHGASGRGWRRACHKIREDPFQCNAPAALEHDQLVTLDARGELRRQRSRRRER